MPIATEFFVRHACAILFVWVLAEQLGLLIAGTVPKVRETRSAGTFLGPAG